MFILLLFALLVKLRGGKTLQRRFYRLYNLLIPLKYIDVYRFLITKYYRLKNYNCFLRFILKNSNGICKQKWLILVFYSFYSEREKKIF